MDALFLKVVPDVLVFVALSRTPFGPPGRFLFKFQEGVDVGDEQTSLLVGAVVLSGLVPVVHLVHLDHAITFLYRLCDIGCTPRAHERPETASIGARGSCEGLGFLCPRRRTCRSDCHTGDIGSRGSALGLYTSRTRSAQPQNWARVWAVRTTICSIFGIYPTHRGRSFLSRFLDEMTVVTFS